MNRLFTAILLLLITGSAFADASHLTHIENFGDSLSPPSTDYSVAYLSQIFGTVGNVLQGTSGQILGKMFDIFNKGVMVCAAIYLMMTLLQTFMRAAHDGTFMGQEFHFAKICLRLALGFALIIPSPTTGYSLMQDIFMKIVVQGVGLADQTWDAALNYLQYGGSLFIPPTTLSTDSNIASSALSGKQYQTMPVAGSAPITLSPVAQIFQDEVCMYASDIWQKQINKQTNKNAMEVDYHPIFNSNAGTISFPGVGNPSDSDQIATPSCGVATSYYESTGQASTQAAIAGAANAGMSVAGQAAAFQTYSYEALKQLVLSIEPAAQSFADTEIPGQPDYQSNPTQDQAYMANNSKAIFASIVAYANLITPYQNLISNDQTRNRYAQPFADAIPNFESQGWITAGSFYWTVENMNSAADAISIGNLFPAVNPPSNSMFSSQYLNTLVQAGEEAYMNATFSSLPGASGDVTGRTYPYGGYAAQVTTLWTNYVSAQQAADNTPNLPPPMHQEFSHLGNGTFSDFVTMVVDSFTHKLSKAVHGVTMTSSYNPISVLMNLGTSLLQVIVDVWVGSIVASVTVALIAGICNSSSPSGLALNAALAWLKSIVMLLTAILLVPGAIFAYYVPLYPYIVFVFATVGWLILVVEGMAAAPLICLGVTHPTGHDFIGKGEQALMLLLSIFLRPALIIIGLIAAMVVSFVAFRMMIVTFNMVMFNLIAPTQNPLLVIINLTMTLIIMSTLTMELIEICFKMISSLPNAVMAWIGAPAQGQDYSQMASQVKGGITSGAKGGEQALQGVGSANKEFGAGMSKANEMQKQNEQENMSNSGKSNTTP